ncbi:TPA: decarboxylating 6-phosphogluconate dehydrogenase [Candidatus Uhrbacteria bacterium]|nr:decarboxylating 6-phosphogluconate dehydrogenase [Candidatus Uhrbacteria bacterium]
MQNMQIGYIGLGKMGKNMVLRLLEKDIKVVAWNRSPQPREEVAQMGAIAVETLDELVAKLKTPRIIWLMLPAGETTNEILKKIIPNLSKGDLVIDGGNSFYKDTLRRNRELEKKGIHFMDIGTSGGPGGARSGACLMIGGSKEDFKRVEKLAKAAAAPGAYEHLGPVGAGHFAKMVHNGIEYGMMESIAEGIAILKTSEFRYDFPKLLDLYNHRSVIESRLVGWLLNAFKKDVELTDISSKISAPGEGEWTLKVAKEMGIPAPAIQAAFKVRQKSENDPESSPSSFRNKVVSAMRGEFGGHPVKKV